MMMIIIKRFILHVIVIKALMTVKRIEVMNQLHT